MGAKSGFTLKLLQWFNRGVQFACCALILALTSYFLAVMSNHSLTIPTNIKAVAGISGIGVIYTAFGILLVCCLAGVTLTSFLAIVLDIAFVGAFIYVATVYKSGASSCSGNNVNSVFGSGNGGVSVSSARDGGVPRPSYGTACRMETAMLAVAIVAIIFFLISAAVELALGRHRKKEQRFGPSPANNYTSGYGSAGKKRGFGALFHRRGTANTVDDPNALPAHPGPSEMRQSYTTDATNVHDGAATSTTYPKYGEAGYAEHGMPPAPVGATTNGFGNVPGHAPPARYGEAYTK